MIAYHGKVEAQEYYNNYFKAYPKVAQFVEKMRRFVEEHGYVETIFGFRRPLGPSGGNAEDNYDDDVQIDSSGVYWGNQAINTPLQPKDIELGQSDVVPG